MRYSVQMRMNNPGVTKFLLESVDKDDFMEAFQLANEMADKCDKDSFVEIVNADNGDKICKFQEVI